MVCIHSYILPGTSQPLGSPTGLWCHENSVKIRWCLEMHFRRHLCVVQLFVLLAIWLAAAHDDAAQERGAVILLHKRVAKGLVAERTNLTFSYEVYNVGTSPAISVQVDDHAGLANLDILQGSPILTFPDIAAGGKAKQTVTVVAESERVLPASRARVTYTYTTPGQGTVTKTGVSNQVGPIEVLSYDAYRRVTSNYTREISFFILGASVSILLPLIYWLWQTSANKQRFRKRR